MPRSAVPPAGFRIDGAVAPDLELALGLEGAAVDHRQMEAADHRQQIGMIGVHQLRAFVEGEMGARKFHGRCGVRPPGAPRGFVERRRNFVAAELGSSAGKPARPPPTMATLAGGCAKAGQRGKAAGADAAGKRGGQEAGGGDVSRRRVLAAIAGGVGPCRLAALARFRPAAGQSRHRRRRPCRPGRARRAAGPSSRGNALRGARRAGRPHPERPWHLRARFAFDEGAQLVNTDHADLLAMIRRFRLPMVDRHAFGPNREIQIGRGGAAFPEARLATALRGIAARITADSRRLDADYANVAREIDPISVKAYLDRHGLRAGDARDTLEAGIRTEFGSEPDEVSALELLFNLPTVDGREVTRLSKSDERYLISGGTDQVARALATEHQGDIRLNQRLAAVDIGGNSVRLTFADGERVTADRVILAMPPTLLRSSA